MNWRDIMERRVLFYRAVRSGVRLRKLCIANDLSESNVRKVVKNGQIIEDIALGRRRVECSTPLDVLMEDHVTRGHSYTFKLGDDHA